MKSSAPAEAGDVETSDPLAQLPAAPDDLKDDSKSETPVTDPDSPPEESAPREESTPRGTDAPRERATVPSVTAPKNIPNLDSSPKSISTSDPSDWEILDEPVKPRSTPAPPIVAPKSPFSNESLQSIARQKNLALPLRDARVVVIKSQRRLDLYSGSTLVKSYRVALGANPVGHKQRQGDNRTPEGRFYICTRNSKTSDFHIFLGLSYPALPDAKRGVNNKQITWREYQIINQRLASRGAPLWETNLGGWVGIHGGTDASFAQKKMRQRGSKDWTAGCIALTNRQIEEIHAATKLGTPVDVRP